MPKQGTDLGVELGQVYKAGRQLLPQVADEMHIAVMNTPTDVKTQSARGGGLGHDPGPGIDDLLTRLLGAVTETEDVLRDVGQALVWTADHYAATDAAAKEEYDRRKAEVDGVDEAVAL